MKKKILLKCLILFFIQSSIIYSINKYSLNKGEVLSKIFYQELDFKLIKNKIIIKAEIQGELGQYILDTGAPLCISRAQQKKMGLPIVLKNTTTDGNGMKLIMESTIVPEINIGNIKYRNIPAIIYNVKNSQFSCFNINGFIGSNLLRFGKFSINWEKRKIIISTSETTNIKGDNINLNKIQSTPIINVKIDNLNDKAIIDTGSNSFYNFSNKTYEFYLKRGLLKKKKIFETIGNNSYGIFGYNKNLNDTIFHFNSLILNKTNFQNIIIKSTNDSISRIGIKLLKKGNFTIDYINRKFYFVSNSQKKSFKIDSFGVDFIIKKNKIYIGSVWKNTKAEYLGLLPGMQVTKIVGLEAYSTCDKLFKLENFLMQKKMLKFNIKQNNETKKILLKKLSLY